MNTLPSYLVIAAMVITALNLLFLVVVIVDHVSHRIPRRHNVRLRIRTNDTMLFDVDTDGLYVLTKFGPVVDGWTQLESLRSIDSDFVLVIESRPALFVSRSG